MLFLLVISTLFALSNSAHECVHGQIHDVYPSWTTHQQYKNHPYDKSVPEGKRRLLTGTYENIRIKPYFNLAGSLDGSTTNYIKQIVGAAVRYLENSFNVIRVDGPLYVSRWCSAGFYTVGDYQNCLGWQTGQTCGNTAIPDAHLSPEFTYSGWREQKADSYDSYSGVSDADLIVYVTADNTGSCGGSTLAYASTCVRDQYNRPIAGYINFCPNALSSQNWINDVDTTLHEITHVVIMSPGHWDRFIDSSGNALGTANTYTTAKGDGRKWLTTTQLTSRAQTFFSCGTLDGLPVESDGGSGSSGAHWEAQWLPNENMGSTLFGGMTSASQFTFALAEDSGWYTSNYNYAVPYYSGYESGCNWFTGCGTSISAFYQTEYRCLGYSDRGCSPDHLAVGTCVTYAGNSGNCYFRMGEESTWCTNTNGRQARCVKTKSSTSSTNFGGKCYTVSCSGTSSVTLSTGSASYTCSSSEEGNLVSFDGQYIECPPVDIVCSDSTLTCNQGNYDSTTGTCLCYPGWTGTRCNTEDRDYASEASSGSGSSYSTTGLCITGSSTAAINGEWTYAGTNEFFPYYTFGSLYLYHRSWQHYWYIGTSLNSATSYTTYSNCGETEIDVTSCSGKFQDTGITITADCSNGNSDGGNNVTPKPVPAPTNRPTIKPTTKPTFKPTDGDTDTTSDAAAFLKWHNDYRRITAQGSQPCAGNQNCPAATNMVRMQWDPAVAKVATAYAESLASSGTFAHNSNRNSQTCNYESDITFGNNCNNQAGTIKLGENIAMSSSTTADFLNVISGWVEGEWQQYTYSSQYQSGAGHFSQVIWADSVYLGCGVGRGTSRGTYVVCNYYTPGNFMGQYPYEQGTTCSNCPTDSTCSNHLCVYNFDDGSTNVTPGPTRKPTTPEPTAQQNSPSQNPTTRPSSRPTPGPTNRPTPQPSEPTPSPTSRPTGTSCGITVTGYTYWAMNGKYAVYSDSYGTHGKPVYGPNENSMYIYYLKDKWYVVQGTQYLFDGTSSWSISYWSQCQQDSSLPLTDCTWLSNAGTVVIESDCGGNDNTGSDTSTSGVRAGDFGFGGFNTFYPEFQAPDSSKHGGYAVYGPDSLSGKYYFHYNSLRGTWYLTRGGGYIVDSYSQSGIFASCTSNTDVDSCSPWSGGYGNSNSNVYKSSTYNASSDKKTTKSDIGIGIVIGLAIMLGVVLIAWLIYFFVQRRNNKYVIAKTSTQTDYVQMTH